MIGEDTFILLGIVLVVVKLVYVCFRFSGLASHSTLGKAPFVNVEYALLLRPSHCSSQQLLPPHIISSPLTLSSNALSFPFLFVHDNHNVFRAENLLQINC